MSKSRRTKVPEFTKLRNETYRQRQEKHIKVKRREIQDKEAEEAIRNSKYEEGLSD